MLFGEPVAELDDEDEGELWGAPLTLVSTRSCGNCEGPPGERGFRPLPPVCEVVGAPGLPAVRPELVSWGVWFPGREFS